MLRSGRMTNRVSSSDAARIACFTFSCTGASFVAMNRVPMFIPCAPIARLATRLRPSAMPPLETKGISSSSAARGSRMKLGTSSSPGWPPHSNPSTLTASQPISCAFSEWRTLVHLWITLIPASFSGPSSSTGLRPAVSTTGTPAVDHGLDQSGVVGRSQRRQDREVHAERLVGHVLAARDFVRQLFGRALRQPGDDPQPAPRWKQLLPSRQSRHSASRPE